MSIKEKLIDDHIVDGDMVTDIIGPAIEAKNNWGVSFQATWVGAPVGFIIFQESIDGLTWFEISSTATGGGAGSKLEKIPDATVSKFRAFFDFTSGTGTLQVKANLKGA